MPLYEIGHGVLVEVDPSTGDVLSAEDLEKAKLSYQAACLQAHHDTAATLGGVAWFPPERTGAEVVSVKIEDLKALAEKAGVGMEEIAQVSSEVTLTDFKPVEATPPA